MVLLGGLVPLLFATGPGSEIQKPLAIVVIGGLVNVVAVAAGYSALYETSSRNKITLDVEFAAVNYTLS